MTSKKINLDQSVRVEQTKGDILETIDDGELLPTEVVKTRKRF
jgi:hypothetical protein